MSEPKWLPVPATPPISDEWSELQKRLLSAMLIPPEMLPGAAPTGSYALNLTYELERLRLARSAHTAR